jgi:hypothetical protein
MKNQNLYTHLFNLRQVLHTMMGYENCWSLHYAMKLNMISHLNSFMDQLHEKDNLIPIPLVLEIDTVTKKPTLKELVDLKNQIFAITQLFKDLGHLDQNFTIISNHFEIMITTLKIAYSDTLH